MEEEIVSNRERDLADEEFYLSQGLDFITNNGFVTYEKAKLEYF